MSDPAFPWTGIFFGAPILGIWYWCTDQVIVQRVLGAKSEAHARGGALFCGLLKILPVFVLVLPGLIARALYPDIRGDKAYPTLVVRLLPSGMIGLMVASLMAALMSSLAATFNSASTLITFDIYRKLNPAGDRGEAGHGRTYRDDRDGGARNAVGAVHPLPELGDVHLPAERPGLHQPTIAAVFLFGVFWPRANRHGAIASLLAGAILGAARFILELNRTSVWISGSPLLSGFVSINFLHFAILIFAVSAAILVVVSLATEPEPEARLRGLTFATLEGDYAPPSPSRATFTLQIAASVVLVVLVVALWMHFA